LLTICKVYAYYFGSTYYAYLKAARGFYIIYYIVFTFEFIGLVILILGICQVTKVARLVPKLKASNGAIAIHIFFLCGCFTTNLIFNSLYKTGHEIAAEYTTLPDSIFTFFHNAFILSMIVKFSKQPLIQVKYRPNGAMAIIVSQSNQVIYERHLTNVRQAL